MKVVAERPEDDGIGRGRGAGRERWAGRATTDRRRRRAAPAHAETQVFVGQNLIHLRTPKITVIEVGDRHRRAGLLELHQDLVAVVYKGGVLNFRRAG